MNDRRTGLNTFGFADIKQFARRDHIAFAALQRCQ